MRRRAREAGAPLDNQVCERALKRAVLHRKNALFYRTLHGAEAGDLFRSLITTCVNELIAHRSRRKRARVVLMQSGRGRARNGEVETVHLFGRERHVSNR